MTASHAELKLAKEIISLETDNAKQALKIKELTDKARMFEQKMWQHAADNEGLLKRLEELTETLAEQQELIDEYRRRRPMTIPDHNSWAGIF